MQEKEDLTLFVKEFSHELLRKIMKIAENEENPEKIIKKQENCVAFPFSISLESRKNNETWQIKASNFSKKRPPLLKNNTFSAGRKTSSDMIESFFLKPQEETEILSPNNYTQRILHQMEHDIHYSRVFRKEDTCPTLILQENSQKSEKPEERAESNSEDIRNLGGSSQNSRNFQENKESESIDNEDKEILELFNSNESSPENIKKKNSVGSAFENKSQINEEENIKFDEIDDENIPKEVKTFKSTPGIVPYQQKSGFSELNNSNITYIEEPSFIKTVEQKKIKQDYSKIFKRNIVRQGVLYRKTKSLINGWEVDFIYLFSFY